MTFVKRFDMIGDRTTILNDLLQHSRNKVGHRLVCLFFIITVDECYRNRIIVLKERLEVVNDNRSWVYTDDQPPSHAQLDETLTQE